MTGCSSPYLSLKGVNVAKYERGQMMIVFSMDSVNISLHPRGLTARIIQQHYQEGTATVFCLKGVQTVPYAITLIIVCWELSVSGVGRPHCSLLSLQRGHQHVSRMDALIDNALQFYMQEQHMQEQHKQPPDRTTIYQHQTAKDLFLAHLRPVGFEKYQVRSNNLTLGCMHIVSFAMQCPSARAEVVVGGIALPR